MLYPSLDPNERFRARRDAVRAGSGAVAPPSRRSSSLAVLALAGGMTLAGKAQKASSDAGRRGGLGAPQRTLAGRDPPAAAAGRGPRRPRDRRARLAAREARRVRRADEGTASTRSSSTSRTRAARSRFAPSGVPLARKTGAVRNYYDPRKVARQMHRKGIYLIGRVVVFQDPYLARARPDLAIKRPDGVASGRRAPGSPGSTRTTGGSGTTPSRSPRPRRGPGFDEIMLDYVRFPSDGDVGSAVYPGRTSVPKGRLIADFAAYAKQRLAPLGVRVSTALFGLSATRDMGIGQVPRGSRRRRPDPPDGVPGPLRRRRARHRLAERRAGRDRLPDADRLQAADSRERRAADPVDPGLELRPEQVLQQVRAARLQGAKGYLLWNASGLYTKTRARAALARSAVPSGREPDPRPAVAVALVARAVVQPVRRGSARARSRRGTMR